MFFDFAALGPFAGGLSFCERSPDQFFGQDELRVMNEIDWQPDRLRLALFIEQNLEQHFTVLVALQYAAKAAPAIDKLFQLHLGFEPGPILEIGRPDQDAVDSGRRNLEKIAALDRIVSVEQRRQATADAGAVVNVDRTARLVRHDLDRIPITPGQHDTHNAEAHILKDGFDERSNLRCGAGLQNETFGWRRTGCVFNIRQ